MPPDPIKPQDKLREGEPVYTKDTAFYRMVTLILGILAFVSIIGLIFFATEHNKEALISVASASVGALAGLFS